MSVVHFFCLAREKENDSLFARKLSECYWCPTFWLLGGHKFQYRINTIQDNFIYLKRLFTLIFCDPIIIAVTLGLLLTLSITLCLPAWQTTAYQRGYMTNLGLSTGWGSIAMKAGCFYTQYQECLPCRERLSPLNGSFYVSNTSGGCNQVLPIDCPTVYLYGVNATTYAAGINTPVYYDTLSNVNGSYLEFIAFGGLDPWYWSWHAYQCNRTMQGELARHNAVVMWSWSNAGLMVLLVIGYILINSFYLSSGREKEEYTKIDS